MGHFSTESIVGWLDLAVFNLIMLSGNFRPGFKITGMALNCGFMMCFLNPDDQTVFSKNFKINPNGAAVSAFLGTCMGSLCAILAVLLPYPLGWATNVMKSSSEAASEDTCKLFIAAVDYFKGGEPSVLIDRQLAHSKKLQAQVGALGGNIDAAYVECLDMGTEGTVRNLYAIHADMLGQIYDILNALQIAMTTEDFQGSHLECMESIGAASEEVVENTCVLLMMATKASEDGEIDQKEKNALTDAETRVTNSIKALAGDFHAARKKMQKGNAVSKDLMSEAFFVFCLSAFGRLVIKYSTTLKAQAVTGKPLLEEIIASAKGILKPPLAYHNRIVSRYWLALLTCFAFSVFIDKYSPSCAITAVFLINTRVGPDVMAMINGLLSVVVGVVCNALMYSFSCKYGNTQALMVISVFYWFSTIFVAYGGSSLAGIGLIMAALAPFAILKSCGNLTPEAEAASAVGLWGGIRALLIAVCVTVLWEIVHIPGWFTTMSKDELDKAFDGVHNAFLKVFDGKDVTDDLGKVSGHLGDAETYNAAAVMEPRFAYCRWKKDFLVESCSALNRVRLDILVLRLALLGDKDKVNEELMAHLNKVEQFEHLKMDLTDTLDAARKLCIKLLGHKDGEFNGLDELETVDGLDELDGFDETIAGVNQICKLPDTAPDTMESDEFVQLSIIFVMLEYVIVHIAEITKGAVKLS
eukprot:TRINITY_DN164_c3_g2_i5.p1 TRINITY_DN164_c3_g2~~TRINITY_DN164_c3_g2_i5.p1  ORF type:complete len:754 (+),score=213.91 TRINITY_DN164_c3_g2_i5:172-2262(+)